MKLSGRAKIVTRIFEESAAGIGNYSIAKRLNASKISPFGRSRGWGTSSVAKILHSRAVLGEFQPHRLIDGKARTGGRTDRRSIFLRSFPINFFIARKTPGLSVGFMAAGAKAPRSANLFSRLAKCAYCKSPMRFENKGYGKKGGRYLGCDRARRGLRPRNHRMGGTTILRPLFSAFVRELDLESLMRSASDKEQSERTRAGASSAAR